jgi:glycosyltransferase involved in cell wall biosynthesis
MDDSARQSDGGLFLSVVVPAHNEEHRLGSALEEIFGFLSTQPYTAEVIVVENGSSDRTLEIAWSFQERHSHLRVIHEDRRGKGLAVRLGMLEAAGQYRFLCDADLSMPICHVNRFLPPALEDPQVAIASREAPGAVVYDEPRHRRLIGRWFNRLTRAILLPGLRDTQCGFKCFRADVAEFLFRRQKLTGMAFDAEVLYIARMQGYRIVEIPIPWYFNADSRVRLFHDSARMAFDLLAVRRNHRLGLYDK